MSSIGYGVHRVFEPNMEQRDLKANKPNLGLIFNKRAEISSQFRLTSRQTTNHMLVRSQSCTGSATYLSMLVQPP